MSEENTTPLRVGNNVFIRTVTFHYTGEVVALSPQNVVLAKAAWIADSGRFADAMSKGKLSEVEPYPDDSLVSIERGAVVDISDWKHDLPRKQI